MAPRSTASRVEPGAVCRRARQRGEQVAGPDVLGSQRHTGDLWIRRGAALGGNRAHLGGQCRQRHARDGGGTQRSGHVITSVILPKRTA